MTVWGALFRSAAQLSTLLETDTGRETLSLAEEVGG